MATLDLQRWAPSLTAFSDWLTVENKTAAKNWLRRLNSTSDDTKEASVAEAVAWDYFTSRVDSVRLVEIPGIGGVDFEFAKDGHSFFVEVTNISLSTATVLCGSKDTEIRTGWYGFLTDQIRQKVRGKFHQARRHMNQPVMIAVTTLHWNASALTVNRQAVEFAMGATPKITMRFDPVTGEGVGDLYQSTDLTDSVFLSPNPILDADGEPLAQAKYEPISGFFLAGFGLKPESTRVFGGLNPVAAKPFNVSLLPDVPFCSFQQWPARNEIRLGWTITESHERDEKQKQAEVRLRQAGLGQLVDETREELRRQAIEKIR